MATGDPDLRTAAECMMGDVERERARWRQWCVDLIRDALRELGGDPTDEDIAAWLDKRETMKEKV